MTDGEETVAESAKSVPKFHHLSRWNRISSARVRLWLGSRIHKPGCHPKATYHSPSSKKVDTPSCDTPQASHSAIAVAQVTASGVVSIIVRSSAVTVILWGLPGCLALLARSTPHSTAAPYNERISDNGEFHSTDHCPESSESSSTTQNAVTPFLVLRNLCLVFNANSFFRIQPSTLVWHYGHSLRPRRWTWNT